MPAVHGGVINVARDFSKSPGGRFAKYGPGSGEEFRRSILVPALRSARSSGAAVIVDFDGALTYPVSFLEEAFGGLVRLEGFTASELAKLLVLQTTVGRHKVLIDLAWKYINSAQAS
jgi:hypothetical protein